LAEVSDIETATATRVAYNGNAQSLNTTGALPQHTRQIYAADTSLADGSVHQSSVRLSDTDFIIQRLEADAHDSVLKLSGHQRTVSQEGGVGSSSGPTFTRGPVFESILESDSWLDSKRDSCDSTASSIRSETSSLGHHRNHLQTPSGDTEAEFDAALDAAVEAAYDDGYEPADSDGEHESTVANALMRVELAKERVRQTEMETMRLNQARDVQQGTYLYSRPGMPEGFYRDDSSDEEERLLEEMTRGYEIEDFAFSQQAAMDAARDSAGLESHVWNNLATSSHRQESNNGLDPSRPISDSSLEPGAVATTSLQQVSSESESDSEHATHVDLDQYSASDVRSKRLSRQNPKQLKIETTKLGRVPFHEPIREEHTPPLTTDRGEPRADSLDRVQVPRKPLPGQGPVENDEYERLDSFSGEEDEDTSIGPPESPITHSLLRKNYSSSSLKSARSRNMSFSNLDDISDVSPGTPSSNPFGSNTRLHMFPTSSTPLAPAFDNRSSADPAESLYLFDGQLHGHPGSGSPGLGWGDAPEDLEPCPNDFLLRPFWLMRCLYQTIAHPRGGYLSSRVFVPQDVWKVKGAKLRNVEDKVAACDYLTAALLKLRQADTNDADAVLEEMQGLEGVLEQVTTNLSRKLGNEVGVQSPGALLKDLNGTDSEPPSVNVPRTASISGKSTTPFSWRRLRSKNSAAGLAAAYSGNGRSSENSMESPSHESLPMTLHPTNRPPKRVVSQAQFSGPLAGYMESLARLFDAAQTIGKLLSNTPSCYPLLIPVVDQIARQVGDPGLRHADKTQVGLELCTRHAAEFFAFYICRFVLADLNILLEKFIKRGTEWVSS
jgi:hypothetical protein